MAPSNSTWLMAAGSEFDDESWRMWRDVRRSDVQGVQARRRRRDREAHADVMLRLVRGEGVHERRQRGRPDRSPIRKSQRRVAESNGALARVHRGADHLHADAINGAGNVREVTGQSGTLGRNDPNSLDGESRPRAVVDLTADVVRHRLVTRRRTTP